jgi:hypothetical protein
VGYASGMLVGPGAPAGGHHQSPIVAQRRQRQQLQRCGGYGQLWKEQCAAGFGAVGVAAGRRPLHRAIGKLTIRPATDTGVKRFHRMVKTAEQLEICCKLAISPLSAAPTTEWREHYAAGGFSLVDGSWWRHPFRGLTGDRCYPIEVAVVVQHHEPRMFGGGGDEQIPELHRAV